jgi:hypothetical protein
VWAIGDFTALEHAPAMLQAIANIDDLALELLFPAVPLLKHLLHLLWRGLTVGGGWVPIQEQVLRHHYSPGGVVCHAACGLDTTT